MALEGEEAVVLRFFEGRDRRFGREEEEENKSGVDVSVASPLLRVKID